MASSEGENSADIPSGEGISQNDLSDVESSACACPPSPLRARNKTAHGAVSGERDELAKGDGDVMVNGISEDPTHVEADDSVLEPKTENGSSSHKLQEFEERGGGDELNRADAKTCDDREQNKTNNVNSVSAKDEEMKDEEMKDEEMKDEDMKDEEMKDEDMTEKEDKEGKNPNVTEKEDKEAKYPDVTEKDKPVKNEDKNSIDDDVVITSCEEKVTQNCSSRPANDGAPTRGAVAVRNTRLSAATQVKMASQSAIPAFGQPKISAVESASKVSSSGPSYRPVARLLINIGLELVREGVIRNLIDIQAEKDKQQKLDAKEKAQLEKLEESWKSIVRKNAVYRVPIKRCQCAFASFTQTTLDFHRQFGRSTRPGRYRCCYCARFRTHIPAKFISHMTKEHQKFARLQPLPLLQCPYCPFEHKQATHLERHVNSCQKKFTLSRNLQFTQNVFDIPVFETKLKMMPVQSVAKPHPVGFPRPSGINSFGGMANPGKISSPAGIPSSATGLSVTDILSACGLSPQIQAQVLSNLSIHSPSVLGRGLTYSSARPGFPTASTSRPALPRPVASTANWMQIPGSSRVSAPTGTRLGNVGLSVQQQKHLEQLSRGMQRPVGPLMAVGRAPPLPALGQSVPVARRAGSPVMRVNHAQFPRKCEICDQPVNELESLRLHLMTVHRELLDSAEFHRRGRTLCCHVCAESFYTKQGALRHYQMQHGATAPRAYHCIKCGAKVVTSILNHLSSQHNITVLDMYEAKFCMLCNTRLKSLNLFESHVVSEHADIFPNRLVLLTMIKALNAASLYKTMGKPDLGPMRPLPQGFAMSGQVFPRGPMDMMQFRPDRPGKVRSKERYSCQSCCIQFTTAEELEFHCEKDHMFKCSRCSERWSSLDLMHRHFMSKHHNEKDACILCGEMVQIGRPTVRHIKRMHIRACSVVIPRLRPKEAMRYLTKRRRLSRMDQQRPGCSGWDGAAKAMLSGGNAGGKAKSEKEDEPKVEEIMEVDGETIVIETNR